MPIFIPSGAHKPSTWKYVKISDDATGTWADIWVPTGAAKLHLTGLNVSVTAAGQVTLRVKMTGLIVGVMDFNEKKATPFTFGSDLVLPAGCTLEAQFKADAGTEDAHITVIGHED